MLKTESSTSPQRRKAVIGGSLKRNVILGTIVSQLLVCATVPAATYYVSPLGNDSNPGTSENKPFRVVQHAVDQMKAGDTLVVLDGVYTGTLEIKSGITIQAKTPRKAVFCGAEVLKGPFEKLTEKIYKTRISTSLKQLFYKNMPMTWARWPNASWSENWDESKKWAAAKKGTGPGVLTSDDFSEITGLDLTGGYCFLRYGKGNSCYSRLIEGFDGKILHWNDDDFYSNTFTGEDGWRGTAKALLTLEETHVYHPIHSKFFLAGDLDLLDAPGEWFVEEGVLYFYPPDGMNPNEAVVMAQTIDYCIYQKQEVSDITIDGIDFFAGSVKCGAKGNSDIIFKNAWFTYPGGDLLFVDRVKGKEADKPIEVAGSNITFEKCLFAGAQNSALNVSGSEVTVQNCVFMENNRHANFEGRACGLNATGPYKITRNTFFNNCSDASRISLDLKNYAESDKPDVSYNNIFNAGIYNSDVSGIYMPIGTQKYAEVHHNWMHNIKGNAFRIDVAGKELNVHHNVFWASKRGMSIEGYGQFNIYNNTDVLNHVPSDLIKNRLNHAGATDASPDSTFPPIDDWNVLNNIVAAFADRVGPREKNLYASQKEKGLVNAERAHADEIDDQNTQALEGDLHVLNRGICVLNRGSIQGNLIGINPELFTNGNLAGLNLIPADSIVKSGVKPNKELMVQGVTSMDSFCGAYDVGGDYWVPGSDWMPYGLNVLKTMAASEQFAKEYSSISITPEINVTGLPGGLLSLSSYND